MNILGLSAFYHDSAACLVQNGILTAAAQEERFTRVKHDYRFPSRAIEYCLAEAGLAPEQIDYVAFYDKPLLKFERLLETYIAGAPAGFKLFRMGMPLWLREKLHLPREMDKGLGGRYKGRYVFTEHHESHAASAFFPSPFDEAAILTLDGVGEWATGSIGKGEGNRIHLLKEMRFPHSLGLLYSAFTYFTGFKVNSGEYKLMGLAPYGRPSYVDRIMDKLIDLKPDGSFRMDMSYFAFHVKDVMTGPKFDALFDGPARAAEAPLTQREMDIAASIQQVTEEIMLRSARHAHELTGSRNLVMAGGVALNCVGNGKILREGPFEKIWIQPAAGDAGGALGAALFTWHQLLDQPRQPRGKDLQRGSLLGPDILPADVQKLLDSVGAVYRRIDEESELEAAVADLIAREMVVGHVAGRMEFGPRALGNRSIIGDARSAKMQSVMNLKIKFRESFRPFAPVVLRESVADWFDMRPDEDSPYMLLVAPVREDKRVANGNGTGESKNAWGIELLNEIRSVVPAITHVDYSARVQTLDEERHGRFYRIVKRFHAATGCPVIINTSFNVRGEPIVCTPRDAWRCFMATDMDALVLDRFILLKSEQPERAGVDRDAYLKEFKLD
ncbi:MAG TPA: carbamoyltransferase [Candidatus Eisenbacteria bacterium]